MFYSSPNYRFIILDFRVQNAKQWSNCKARARSLHACKHTIHPHSYSLFAFDCNLIHIGKYVSDLEPPAWYCWTKVRKKHSSGHKQLTCCKLPLIQLRKGLQTGVGGGEGGLIWGERGRRSFVAGTKKAFQNKLHNSADQNTFWIDSLF